MDRVEYAKELINRLEEGIKIAKENGMKFLERDLTKRLETIKIMYGL